MEAKTPEDTSQPNAVRTSMTAMEEEHYMKAMHFYQEALSALARGSAESEESRNKIRAHKKEQNKYLPLVSLSLSLSLCVCVCVCVCVCGECLMG